MDRDLPEAKVVVYTTADIRGWEVTATIRGDSNTPSAVVDMMDHLVHALEGKGWKPVLRSKGGFPKKEQKFTGKKCPKCGADTVEATTKDGRVFEKCSTNKWNAFTKQAEGCDYTNWTYQQTNGVSKVNYAAESLA